MKIETLIGIVGMGALIFFSINWMRDQSLVLYAHQHPQNSPAQKTNTVWTSPATNEYIYIGN